MPTAFDRPDPDALLERIRQGEARARRGRLRIYFGSSAGVGKTYAMLLRSQQHGVGLADPGRRAKIDAQPAAPGACLALPDALQQGIWIGTIKGRRHPALFHQAY